MSEWDPPQKGDAPPSTTFYANNNPRNPQYQRHQVRIDVSNSNLQPDAVEFHPGTSYQSQGGQNSGAVRRNGRTGGSKARGYNRKSNYDVGENRWSNYDGNENKSKNDGRQSDLRRNSFEAYYFDSGETRKKGYNNGRKNNGDTRKNAYDKSETRKNTYESSGDSRRNVHESSGDGRRNTYESVSDSRRNAYENSGDGRRNTNESGSDTRRSAYDNNDARKNMYESAGDSRRGVYDSNTDARRKTYENNSDARKNAYENNETRKNTYENSRDGRKNAYESGSDSRNNSDTRRNVYENTGDARKNTFENSGEAKNTNDVSRTQYESKNNHENLLETTENATKQSNNQRNNRNYNNGKKTNSNSGGKDNWYSKRWGSNNAGANTGSNRKTENWRQRISAKDDLSDKGSTDSGSYKTLSASSSAVTLRQDSTQNQKLNAASQRERLEHMIAMRTLECLVCCERLRHTDKVWNCKQCYHVIHLNCVVKWAVSSKLEEGWRCPACQNVYHKVPKEYRCYCDRQSDPRPEPGTLPHSCGEVCGRRGRGCSHRCGLICHPGPCPDCTVMVGRDCGCGATKQTVKCSSDVRVVCQGDCGKLLNCGLHRCKGKCHPDDCDVCKEVVTQVCHCDKESRTVPCSEEALKSGKYECGGDCGKQLGCGNHRCEVKCHDGECERCLKDPMFVKTCPCGQSDLKEERKSCLDPIPCCDKVCNKKLHCGQPGNPHLCKQNCHGGSCPPCPLTTFVKCRCGHMDKEIDCKDVTSKADDARCQKKCTKKRTCTKHKCNQFCCIDIDHDCPLPCNHTLTCGLHKCEELCHRGRCPPCWRTSFQELYCECGSSVVYPPVPCGTKPPPCTKPCSRIRSCGHEQMHMCHPGPCPPCTLFTSRLCHGQHEIRQTIQCHQDDFSCGMPCNRDMPCTRHKCVQVCHKDACPTPCTQPCTTTRSTCEHPCNQPCHEAPCPNTPCKQMVVVTCECGLRSSTRLCLDLAGEYQKIAMSQLASKMADIQRGQSVDIADITNRKGSSHKTLDCNDECRIVERNRRMAIGLQLRNPDLSAKLTPRYSEYMRGWVKKDPRFCQTVHDKLTELVQLAKQSKQKSRSHSFECMNREKRHFVHEYGEHFGCETAAYDREPNRNVVATAFRDKSWLPSVSLLELLQRENGQRKVPGPVISKPALGRSAPQAPSSSVSMKLPGRAAGVVQRPPTPPGEYIDYFDNPP